LGRPPVSLDRNGMSKLIKDRKILITGAGGSIGGELVRQVCAFLPKHIILLDRSEFFLYEIDMEVAQSFSHQPKSKYIADVADQVAIDKIFAAERPDVVFHAAALK